MKWKYKKSTFAKVTNSVLLEEFEGIERLKKLIGEIKFFDSLYEYKSCPGKDNQPCGKAIKKNSDQCSRIGCNWVVNENDLVNDWNIRAILFDSEGNAHTLLVFKKTLEKYLDTTAKSVEDSLSTVLNRTVEVQVNCSINSDSNDIMESLKIIVNGEEN